MKKINILFSMSFLLLSVVNFAFAKNQPAGLPSDLFRQASAAYKVEDFDKAVELYEAIVSQGENSGTLFYNLGNSYMKKGQVGKAVLNYERAKQFIPRDPDLKANIRYAYSLLRSEDPVDPNFFKRLMEGYKENFTIDELTILIFVFFFLTGAIYYGGLFLRWPAKIHATVIILSTALLFVNGGIFYNKVNENNRAAIVLTNTSARFEPLPDATAHYELQQGQKIFVLKKDLEWLKIERGDKKQGWIPQSTAEKIQ